MIARTLTSASVKVSEILFSISLDYILPQSLKIRPVLGWNAWPRFRKEFALLCDGFLEPAFLDGLLMVVKDNIDAMEGVEYAVCKSGCLLFHLVDVKFAFWLCSRFEVVEELAS